MKNKNKKDEKEGVKQREKELVNCFEGKYGCIGKLMFYQQWGLSLMWVRRLGVFYVDGFGWDGFGIFSTGFQRRRILGFGIRESVFEVLWFWVGALGCWEESFFFF